MIHALDDRSVTALAEKYGIHAASPARVRLALSTHLDSQTAEDEAKTYAAWLDQLSEPVLALVNELAFHASPFSSDELDALLTELGNRLSIPHAKDALNATHLLFQDSARFPTMYFLHPGVRHHLVVRGSKTPHTESNAETTLNPLFHPLVPLRRFLAAIAHESYRTLSDDSYFFKTAARKLTEKFPTPPSPSVLMWLFRFATQLDWIRIRRNRAQLSLDTLYHLNFSQATFLYFCYGIMSLPLPFWLSLRENGARALYSLPELDRRLSRLHFLKSPTPLTPSLRGFSHATPTLTASDLISLGFFIPHSQDNQSFVKLNPWFHTWLFDHVPPLRRERSIHFKSRFLAQATYDLVVPPDLAWPSFLQLISLASGEVCDLVCHLKLSKKSVHHGIKAGVDPSEIIPFFEHHAWSLPDNVKRSLLDWIHVNDLEHPHTGATRTMRDERDLFPIEDMRKQLNTLTATSLYDWLHPKRKGAREALSIVGLSAPEKIVSPKMNAHTTKNPIQDAEHSAQVEQAPKNTSSVFDDVKKQDTLPPDFRENLFLIEDCIRRKHLLQILHRPRENREKWRTILPLRLQRDGVAIFLEAHCKDMDVIRSFKLNQILEVKLA